MKAIFQDFPSYYSFSHFILKLLFHRKRYLSSEKVTNIKYFLIVYFLTAIVFFGFSSRNEALLKLNPYSNRLVIYSLKSQNIIQQNNRSCENRLISEICFFDTESTERKVYSLGGFFFANH